MDAKFSSAHQTLGQIADKIQEQARAVKSVDPAALDENEEDADDGEEETTIHGGESTGRWTKEEHELFLEALKRYGKVRC